MICMIKHQEKFAFFYLNKEIEPLTKKKYVWCLFEKKS